MARNGSGTYSRVAGTPYVYNTVIDETVVNNEFDDIATALTNSLAKNGETTPTANLPMGTFRHTGVGNASARTDYAAAGQVQDGKLNWVDGGGTADAITATYSPAITALVDGQLCFVRATAANATTTPTFAPNGLTARTIVQMGGLALVAGSIRGDGHELILRYDLTNTRWELLNPNPVVSGTWTPTQGAGLTVVGAFSSSGTYRKDGNKYTVQGRVSGATSVAVSSGGILCGGLPAAPTGVFFYTGTAINAAATASSVVGALSTSNVYAASNIAATTDIDFTITYFI